MPTIYLNQQRYDHLISRARECGYTVSRGRDSQIGEFIESLTLAHGDVEPPKNTLGGKMSQKSVTVNGKRFTAKDIKKQLTPEHKTRGGDYRIKLNGQEYIAHCYYNTNAMYIPDDIAPDGVYIEEYNGGPFAGEPIYIRFE